LYSEYHHNYLKIIIKNNCWIERGTKIYWNKNYRNLNHEHEIEIILFGKILKFLFCRFYILKFRILDSENSFSTFLAIHEFLFLRFCLSEKFTVNFQNLKIWEWCFDIFIAKHVLNKFQLGQTFSGHKNWSLGPKQQNF
jgi:hypothetical protein